MMGFIKRMAGALMAGMGMIVAAPALHAAATPAGPAFKSGMIDRIDPPCWWTGMACDTLQLMVNGPGIGDAEFALQYPGVQIIRQFRLDSPNYKFIYLRIAPDAQPGKLKLKVKEGKRESVAEYPLLRRDRNPEDYPGFDAGDVLYLVMPDRFAKGEPADRKAYERGIASLRHKSPEDRANPNARHGGNIAGLRQHLPYIDSLGVTTLWVCPVLENDMPGGSYHGYATTDYYRVDPRFGTNDEYAMLVGDAHKRGMKVVMDMIFNHSGSEHPWMKDAPAKDWYNHPDGKTMTNFRLTTVHDPYASDYDKDHTVNGWFVPDMPDLNQRNPELMRYLTQNSIWWIESAKIDGIRMDTYPYCDMEAMAGWCAAVLREYPRFNIVGECWYADPAGSAFWQKGSKINEVNTQLPTVMDFFAVLDKGRAAFSEQTDPWHGLNALYDHLAQDFIYPDPQRILTFIENHDTDRFLREAPQSVEDLGQWKQALTWILTSRGIPQLYYGTELLMSGSKEGSDGYVRRDMPGGFPGDTTDAFTAAGRTAVQNDAWNFLSRLLQWRRGDAKEVIAKGSLRHFMPQNGIYAYQRKFGDKEVIVLMNGNDKQLTVTMERTLEVLPYGTVLHDIVSDRDVTITEEMMFAPRQVMILANFR